MAAGHVSWTVPASGRAVSGTPAGGTVSPPAGQPPMTSTGSADLPPPKPHADACPAAHAPRNASRTRRARSPVAASPCCATYVAAAPATCGDAIDVPDIVT